MDGAQDVGPKIAVIGGSGFYDFPDLRDGYEVSVETPYSEVVRIKIGQIGAKKVAFLARHGTDHRVPPHKINYRANIWALKKVGVQNIIAINSVGGIADSMGPGAFVVPDQIIDYTYRRDHTFADVLSDQFNHVDFTWPFSVRLRCSLIEVLKKLGVNLADHATYGCTQGPRLETAAEVTRLKNDGCDVIGMTGMPEAALAREIGVEYTMVCSVVNWAAGIGINEITMEEINQLMAKANPILRQLLVSTIVSLSLN